VEKFFYSFSNNKTALISEAESEHEWLKMKNQAMRLAVSSAGTACFRKLENVTGVTN